MEEEFDVAEFLLDFEQEHLTDQETIDGFQQLINSGVVWQLQGCYGRTAAALIEAGFCTNRIQ